VRPYVSWFVSALSVIVIGTVIALFLTGELGAAS
jgi:hypothetical protein